MVEEKRGRCSGGGGIKGCCRWNGSCKLLVLVGLGLPNPGTKLGTGKGGEKSKNKRMELFHLN